MLEEDKNTLKEAHGSGLISTLVFLAVAICVMVALRYFLNYQVLRCYARRHLVGCLIKTTRLLKTYQLRLVSKTTELTQLFGATHVDIL